MILTHDVVEPYTTLGSGVSLAGQVGVGEGAYLGTRAAVHPDRTIGTWSVVAMGAAMRDDIPTDQNVGRRLRTTPSHARRSMIR